MQLHSPTHTVQDAAFVTVDAALRLVPLSRSSLYQLLRTGAVKSHVLRVFGNTKGRRLINRESLVGYVEKQPSGYETAEAAAK